MNSKTKIKTKTKSFHKRNSKNGKQLGRGLFDIFRSKEKILANKLKTSEKKLLKYAQDKVKYAEMKKLSAKQLNKLTKIEEKYDARKTLVKTLKKNLGLYQS